MKDSKNIRIGGAEKGNVISGFPNDIGTNIHENGGQIQHYCENVFIKSNFISIEPDGFTVSSIPVVPILISYVYGQVEIGGTPQEGNIFAKGFEISQANSQDYTGPGSEINSLPATIKISNNNIGVDYSGLNGIVGGIGIQIGTHNGNGKNTISIDDNVISSSLNGIFIVGNGQPVSIKRNFIGTDRTRTKKLTIGSTGVVADTDVMIGSSDPADANYIAYCKPVGIWSRGTATVNKNSFFCTVEAYPMFFDSNFESISPVVEILASSAVSVSGTSTPNATIELFYSDRCGTCSPETYFGTTTADGLGNWQYNGSINGSVIASATINSSTSEFTHTRIYTGLARIVHTCSATGSITGTIAPGATHVKWFNADNDVIGTNLDLTDLTPGIYRLQAVNGDCIVEESFEVQRRAFLDTSDVHISNPCGSTPGYIRNVLAIDNTFIQPIYRWTDGNGVVVADTQDLNNIGPGTYTVNVSTYDFACSETYGPVTLINSGGPVINLSSVNATPSVCGGNTGSITGISVSGTGNLGYKWTNLFGLQVAAVKDLLNQPAGTYILEVTDNSVCGPAYSTAMVIPEINGITFMDAGSATPATCGNNNGSISGITVIGASNYKWYDSQDQLVSTTLGPSLNNAAPGTYYLVVSNSSCNKKTQQYTINNLVNTTDYGQPVQQVVRASCGMNNGSIQLTFNANVPAGYRWVDKNTGQTIGVNPSLQGLDVGLYQLYAADENGCEKLVGEYMIVRVPALTLNGNGAVVTADDCELGSGNITGIHASGLAPLSYEWKNLEGETVSTNLNLTSVKANTYQLTVRDGSGCEQTLSYSVQSQSANISPPDVSDLRLCGAGIALLAVNNRSEQYGYKLYDQLGSLVPLDDQASGIFKIPITQNRSYYVSTYSGSCESNKVEVKVQLGSTAMDIPNTFTPNGDGLNDTWLIKGIENYPHANIQVFNRHGAKVFESLHNQSAFDGTCNSTSLPVGVYYYIININEGCNLLSGSLTIIK